MSTPKPDQHVFKRPDGLWHPVEEGDPRATHRIAAVIPPSPVPLITVPRGYPLYVSTEPRRPVDPTRFELLRDMRPLRDLEYDVEALLVPHKNALHIRESVVRATREKVPLGSVSSIRFPDGSTSTLSDFIGWLPMDYEPVTPKPEPEQEAERLEHLRKLAPICFPDPPAVAIGGYSFPYDGPIPNDAVGKVAYVNRETGRVKICGNGQCVGAITDTEPSRTVGANAEATSNAPSPPVGRRLGYTAADIRSLRPDWTDEQVAKHIGMPLMGELPKDPS